jgi:RNase adapter protein RapZ
VTLDDVTRVLVVTGLSGAGRSVAAGALEDIGWFVIDNLPADLVPKVGELASSAAGGYDRVALVMGGYGEPLAQIEALRAQVQAVTVVFLEATTDVLVRRYESTRRRHRLAGNRSLIDAIEDERAGMQGVRAAADLVIDTSDLNPHQLREQLNSHFQDEDEADKLRITLSSFGFKHGLPLDADMVLDCRFIPNPHWVEELRPLSGLDPEIQAYVLDRRVTQQFVGHLTAMLVEVLPAYMAEGKSYLSVAFGCTGGRHRSVAVAERVNQLLTERGWRSRASHRDINREHQ